MRLAFVVSAIGVAGFIFLAWQFNHWWIALSDHVFVTYKWDEDDYETSELDYWVTKCAAEEGNKQCQMFIDHVIAWSFMPQPYKEI